MTLLNRDEFNLIVPTSKKGKKGQPGGGKPKNEKTWNIDDPDEEDDTDGGEGDGGGETGEKSKDKNQQGQGDKDGSEESQGQGSPDFQGEKDEDDKYKGGKKGQFAKIRNVDMGSIGDVVEPGVLDDIEKKAQQDEVNINGPMKSYKGKQSDTKDAEDMWTERVQQLFDKGIGTDSLDFVSLWKTNMTPKVNWKRELAKFFNDVFAQTTDWKYFKRSALSRGEWLHAIKPEEKKGYKNAVVAVDTSGSIGQAELDMFATELQSLCKKVNIEKLYIIYCDADIQGDVQLVSTSEKFKLEKLEPPKGGGGTSFYPPFKWIYNNKINPAFVLYFTDAMGDAPEPSNPIVSKYKNRVFWVIDNLFNLDQDQQIANHLKFGRKILVSKKDFQK